MTMLTTEMTMHALTRTHRIRHVALGVAAVALSIAVGAAPPADAAPAGGHCPMAARTVISSPHPLAVGDAPPYSGWSCPPPVVF